MTQHPFLAAICSGAGRVLLVGGLLAAPAVAPAQQLHELSLEELMRIDAGRVFGASERIQPVTEAPASVTFVTKEEIACSGRRRSAPSSAWTRRCSSGSRLSAGRPRRCMATVRSSRS